MVLDAANADALIELFVKHEPNAHKELHFAGPNGAERMARDVAALLQEVAA